MFAVVSTQCPDTPCLLEFNRMKEEEPWATLLKNTRLEKFNQQMEQAFLKTQGGNWGLIRMNVPAL
jgi:hypothetical protein